MFSGMKLVMAFPRGIVAGLMVLSLCAGRAWTQSETDLIEGDFPWVSMVLPERDLIYHPEEAVDLMGLKKGDRVADVGAGAGYWTFPLAKAVGPTGKVYAIDIDADYFPELYEYFGKKVLNDTMNVHDNIRIMRTLEDDIGMPPETLDAAFLCQMGILRAAEEDAYSSNMDTYSYNVTKMRISRRVVESIFRALKPGGELIVIDMFDSPLIRSNRFYSKSLGQYRAFVAAKSKSLVKENFERMGFIFEKEYDLYSDEEHKQDVREFQSLPVYRKLSPKARLFYVNDMFFFIFKKPVKASVPARVTISADRGTYRAGETIRIKAEYRNLPEEGIRLTLEDRYRRLTYGEERGRFLNVSVVPRVYHADGEPVESIALGDASGGNKFFPVGPEGEQPEWKIRSGEWKDPVTGKIVYRGAGFTAQIGPSGSTLYCLDRVPGEYTVTLTREMKTYFNGGEPIIKKVVSNPVSFRIIPGED
ncbi:MAG: hypothetical protein GF409_05405 [Candidatus Omnitrophica bacterium]|nr:hypothetical protein [Candidatus Omnitrophota bacterium]